VLAARRPDLRRTIMKPIEKVAVLGAGTMGARLAAHLANAGVPCFLLDIVPPELTPEEKSRGLTLDSPAVRNRITLAGLEAARKSRPAAFLSAPRSELITCGNFEDHLAWCGEADWIIEAVAERLDIKRSLLERVEHVRRPGAVVSSNTSGLPIRLIAQGRSQDFLEHWAGTHFFNPPRYMKLVELIPGPHTRPEVLRALEEFCDLRLGKGVVLAKDTPNFIANRIGTFSMLNVLRLMNELEMTVEEVDACTGPAVGWPKSATFRTADLVGLDVLASVVRNIHENAVSDECREIYRVPPLIEEMIKRGWLGEKTGGGFYKKIRGGDAGEDQGIFALDWKTFEYRPRAKARLGSIEAGRQVEETRERLRMLLEPVFAGGKTDKAQQFLWGAISEMCSYAARRVPEISDSIVDVDRAMRWGFAWELGPFELWDAAGLARMARQLEKEKRPVPPLVEKLLASGRASFYEARDKGTAACFTYAFDLESGRHQPLAATPGVIVLAAEKDRARVVERNAGASLVDLGDGVVCCEFHSKANSIGGDALVMLQKGVARLKTDFEAMVVANQGTNFSVGANLMLVMMAVQEQEWDELHMAVRQFQNTSMALKYAPRPVVVAPHALTLGGGCEFVLHAARVHAAGELYIGLVEAGVGLIPAGGGCKEMVARANASVAAATGGARAIGAAGLEAEQDLDLFHAMKPVFENIAMARVATSCDEARSLGYLRSGDLISMNRDRLIADAKETALGMLRAGWKPPLDRRKEPALRVLGEQLIAGAKLAVHMMLRGEYISEHDAVVARKLAWVLAGGALSSPQLVSEQYLLDLEREAFVSLCGERKTLERISHTLKTGKPLRN
jgi:3-hydroxyacyl-CoA dehydrogenase